jgi:hypothetical protein
VLSQVADATHNACEALLNKIGGVHSQTVAVLAIEVGGEGATTLVTEVVCNGAETTLVSASLTALG